MIFPLFAISMQQAQGRFNIPKAEEISHFFLARVVGNVLHLDSGSQRLDCQGKFKSVREQRWTTWCIRLSKTGCKCNSEGCEVGGECGFKGGYVVK